MLVRRLPRRISKRSLRMVSWRFPSQRRNHSRRLNKPRPSLLRDKAVAPLRRWVIPIHANKIAPGQESKGFWPGVVLSFLYLTNKSNMYKMKRSRNYRLLCRISTSVVYQLPKLRRRVRLPYPAWPHRRILMDSAIFVVYLGNSVYGGLFHGNWTKGKSIYLHHGTSGRMPRSSTGTDWLCKGTA